MPDGPVIIFDKSALQMLSVDESAWLDNFYRTNITPLFYVETLADLEKRSPANRTPEDEPGRKSRRGGSKPESHQSQNSFRSSDT
jgi:hypothetical protein